ncbi:MAG: glycosyltransferase family 4 protein [Proteobacteria bacterium]|nr:glycosyltransferase family 4 protein [Pseudomonadota bacterium]
MTEPAEIVTTERDAAGRPPAVMQVLPSLVTGGVERGAVDIAAALVAEGWRSIIVSSGGPMVREVLRAGAEHIELPVHSKNPLVMRRNTEKLAGLIRQHDVDIVHARSRAPAWCARRAARQAGARFMTTFHATYNLGLPLKRLYNSVMVDGERMIAISDYIARHAIQTYRVDPGKIRVIHRGIDIDHFDPARVSAERLIKLSTDWRLPDGVPVIMMPGRLTRWKGQGVLIEAIARLGRNDIRCLIVGAEKGRGSYRRDLEALVAKHGLNGVVHLVGNCNDMPAALMLADVVVHASTDPEGFGRVIAEAQAMGRPVIAADHGASCELVVTGQGGWLTEPGNPDALAAALSEALALDPGKRADIAAAAIRRVRARFSKQAMSEATLGVYRELLEDTRDEGEAAA